ncbi:hypothetical protein ANASTE_00717 [Anaerofustis stercorihominis DSM 17244]|uniref:Uncharacterized protein n=1 Tax=Anaerofustis stercorihominis DSM 17244 TaxID=445971 RepID=B1C7L5_9FIRM|nr:hypothetical protein [Anaerofustis stercorihominis]EDS73002.1 hypothetical protein ANASTE_00717 [Anaerofustis stercorihominis DSM 17244]
MFYDDEFNKEELNEDLEEEISEDEESEDVFEEETEDEDSEDEDIFEEEEEDSEEDNENNENESSNDFQRIIDRRIARERSKNEKKLAEYEPLLHTIKEAYGIEGDMSVSEINEKLKSFYEENGQSISDYKPRENKRDAEILAEAEARDIIEAGNDELLEEYNRLRNRGDLNYREQIVFNKLEGELAIKGAEIELSKSGKDPKILRDKDFMDFAGRYRNDISILDIYNDYERFFGREEEAEKKGYKPAGSVKDNKKDNKGIKDFYTPDEVDELTDEDFDKYPELLDIVNRSMEKWK